MITQIILIPLSTLIALIALSALILPIPIFLKKFFVNYWLQTDFTLPLQ